MMAIRWAPLEWPGWIPAPASIRGEPAACLPHIRSWVTLTRRWSLCCAVGNQLCSATGALPDTDGDRYSCRHHPLPFSEVSPGRVTLILSFLWMHSGENSSTLWQARSLPGLCSCEQWAAPLSKAWAMQVQHPLRLEHSCCSEGGCFC